MPENSKRHKREKAHRPRAAHCLEVLCAFAPPCRQSSCGWRAGLALLLLGLGGAAAKGGEDDVFADPTNLVAVFRVNHLTRTSRKIENLLRNLNPHTTIRDPIQELAGRYLRNPGLDELATDAFLEILLLKPDAVKGSPYVVAFPVRNATAYRKVLTSQLAIREEGTADDITTLREETREGPVPLYLAITSEGIAVFGTSLDAVRYARREYDRRGKHGILHDRPADLAGSVHLRSLVSINETTIRNGLRQLREDIVRDVVGPAAKTEHPLNLALRRGFASLNALLLQLQRFDLLVSLDQTGLSLAGKLRPVNGQKLQDIFAHAVNGRPRLASFLPGECVSCQDVMLWPEMWREIVEGCGTILTATFGGVVSRDVQAALQNYFAAVAAAQPIEIAAGLLPPPSGKLSLGPTSVKLVRWGQAEHLGKLLDQTEKVIGAEAITRLLDRNGIKFTVERQRERARIGSVRVEFWRLYLRMVSGEKEGLAGFIGRRGEYLVATVGNVIVFVTSRAVDGRSGSAAAHRQRLAVMELVLKALTLSGEAESLPDGAYARALAVIGDRQTMAVAAVSPLEYVQLALDAAADWNAPFLPDGRPPAPQRHANDFRNAGFNSAKSGFYATLSFPDGNAQLWLLLPQAQLRALVRACLGLSRGVRKEK